MVKRITLTIALASLLGAMMGCGNSGGQPAIQAADPVVPARPGLEELRTQPRAEIAKKADEVLVAIRAKEEARKKEKLTFELLPKWHQPLVVPGFQDQKYNPDLGYSIPSYVDAKDPAQLKELVDQFARAGDVEVAIKLGGGARSPDAQSHKDEKHYPVEWTRFVAIQMHALMQNLAIGEENALPKLMAFRAELDKTLDDKAKQSLLGQTLLPRGKDTLEAVRAVCQQKGETDLVSRVDAALKDWPANIVAVPLDETQEQLAKLLKTKAQGRVVSCQPPVRALDLLQLPLPHEAADAALLFFDTAGRLEEIIVAYNPRLQVHFPQPKDLVGLISDWSAPTASSVTECKQRWGTLAVDTRYGPFESTISGWVRLRLSRPPVKLAIPRDFGAVHLDWSFEHNRLHSAPNVVGNPLILTEGALRRVENPLPAGKLKNLTLQALPEHSDLLLEGRYAYAVGVAWHEVAMPLFAAFGSGKWVDERTGDILAGRTLLTWEDAKTRMYLEVPHQPRDAMTFVHGDRRETTAAAEREGEVASREANDRRQRLDAGQPLVKLPRKVDALALGAPKAEVVKYLPRGQDAYRIPLADGLVVVNNAPPPKDKSQQYLLRQVIVRFDQADKLRWVRTWYEPNVQPQIGKKTTSDWTQSMLGYWRQQGGTVAPQESPRQVHLRDLPDQPGSAFYLWQDDLTQVSFLQNRHGVEITARDLSLENEGKPLTSLEYLPRGPSEGIPELLLGLERTELEKKLTTKPVVNSEGAWVIALANGRYDIVVIWLNDKDRVHKIATRYRQGDAPKVAHKDMEKQLNERWGAELRQIGWPMRRDVSHQAAVQAYSFLDDATRYRLYWADSDNSPPRLWSEWLDVTKPLAVK